jgi:predicted amidophosphoribosyltransferase
MENIQEKIKICKLCGSSKNKFGPHCHQCIKCLSKRKNAKANEKNYFKTYYIIHQ